MIKKVNKFVEMSRNNKNLLTNIFSLSILQVSNYILPLILFPYLVHTLGINNFGILSFATATIAFFRGVVAYGFDLSGTKLVSVNRDDKKKLTEIFSSILAVKLILLILSFIVLCFLFLYVEKFGVHLEVFLYTFLLIIGDILFPIWFFQGIENMKIITYLRIIHKLFFVIIVFWIVKKQEQYYLVPLFDSIGSILVAIVALYVISKQYHIHFVIPSYINIINQFKDGWHIFISRIAVTIYGSANIFVLGMLSSDENVGIYSVAEKVYQAIRSLTGPVVTALFPFLSKKFTTNNTQYFSLVKKISFLFFCFLLLSSIITFYFSHEIIFFVAGKTILEAADVLKIFSPAIALSIGTFYTTLLIIKSRQDLLVKITFLSMVLNLMFVYPAIYFYGIYGLAWQITIIQTIHFILQVRYNSEIFSFKQTYIFKEKI